MFGYVPPRSTEQGIKHFTTLRYGHKPKFGKPSKRGGLFTEKKKKNTIPTTREQSVTAKAEAEPS